MSDEGVSGLKLEEGDIVKVFNRNGHHTLLYPIKGGWMTVCNLKGRIEAVKNSAITKNISSARREGKRK